MEINDALKRLSALAQDGRLEAFRLLVKVGPDGMAAGEVARKLGVQANTLSAQLLEDIRSLPSVTATTAMVLGRALRFGPLSPI